jgi:hypothetical protein
VEVRVGLLDAAQRVKELMKLLEVVGFRNKGLWSQVNAAI